MHPLIGVFHMPFLPLTILILMGNACDRFNPRVQIRIPIRGKIVVLVERGEVSKQGKQHGANECERRDYNYQPELHWCLKHEYQYEHKGSQWYKVTCLHDWIAPYEYCECAH